MRARSASRFAGVPTLPLVLGVPLGFMVRSDHRRGRPIPGGDQAVFLQDRVALILPSLAAALAAWSLWREFGRTT